MVAPTSLDDESYLEAVQALRGMAMGPLSARARAAATAGGRSLANAQIAALPEVGIRDRVLRSSQEMLWRRTALTYDKNRAGLLAELSAHDDREEGHPPAPDGRTEPDYLREHHLQAGGYHGDELAGFVYHYGTKVFWLGANDRDQAKESIVAGLPLPAGGPVRRALELACSVGQSTTALKARFPEAEVWGIDVAAPMVRYARWRAAGLGSDVRFRQQAAEDLTFADASFDLVYGSLLFHEVPVPVGQRIVRQAARVLRPGGVFIVNDLNPLELTASPWSAYERWWDTEHNAEPYELEFLSSDLTAELAASFSRVEFTPEGYNGRWVAYR
jgi:ubiquinone/menaquinone biosynthesis C-methylase UbiE